MKVASGKGFLFRISAVLLNVLRLKAFVCVCVSMHVFNLSCHFLVFKVMLAINLAFINSLSMHVLSPSHPAEGIRLH